MQCLKQKPTTLPYKLQNSSLQIYVMRDPFIDICRGVNQLCVFYQFHSTDSSWFHLEISLISYSSLGEFREASVIGEVSRRFHERPLSKLSLPFVHSRSSHPTKGLFSMHRTSHVQQMRCITHSLCYRCADQTRPLLLSDFGFYVHSLQLYLGVLLSVISIPPSKPPSFPSFRLHCAKNCECFYVFSAIFSSLLQSSSIVELSSFDLKVSQVSFSVKERNSIVLNG